MSSRIRARELRLGRSFQRIVLSVVSATPLAGALACSTAPDGARQPTGTAAIDGGIDATVSRRRRGRAAPTLGSTASTVVVDSASGASPAACDSIPFDGAAIEGDQDGCVTYRALPCGLPPTARREGCFVDLATCIGICGCDPSEGGFFIYCQLSSVSCDDAGNVLDAAKHRRVRELQWNLRPPPPRPRPAAGAEEDSARGLLRRERASRVGVRRRISRSRGVARSVRSSSAIVARGGPVSGRRARSRAGNGKACAAVRRENGASAYAKGLATDAPRAPRR